MHKINHSSLIVSIAVALLIFGASITIGLRTDWYIGLIIGAFSFIILVAVMMIFNAKQK